MYRIVCLKVPLQWTKRNAAQYAREGSRTIFKFIMTFNQQEQTWKNFREIKFLEGHISLDFTIFYCVQWHQAAVGHVASKHVTIKDQFYHDLIDLFGNWTIRGMSSFITLSIFNLIQQTGLNRGLIYGLSDHSCGFCGIVAFNGLNFWPSMVQWAVATSLWCLHFSIHANKTVFYLLFFSSMNVKHLLRVNFNHK